MKGSQKNSTNKGENTNKTEEKPQQAKSQHVTDDIHTNIEQIKQNIGHNTDVIFRSFQLGTTKLKAAIVYVDGLVDKDLIQDQILKSMIYDLSSIYSEEQLSDHDHLKDWVNNNVISVSDVKEEKSFDNVITSILTGSTALLIDNINTIFILGTTSYKTRSIEEPITESLVRGPREGFNESLADNRALLRRGLPDPALTMLEYEMGVRSKKKLLLVYMEGITNPDLLMIVKKRLEKFDLDLALESGYIEQFIQDDHFSLFPQVQSTERPDRVIAALTEGRVAILLDGTPFALIAPVTFSMMLQSPEDYYERWIPGSLIRLLRYFAAFITVFVPSIYVSFISFHQGLIPTKLAISIAATREGVPFPSLIEALLMETAIEVLREAGLRLPRPVGQTVGLVGGLVVGEAAVKAGIVSPIMVIIVAITAISSFAIPQYSAGIALRMLRFGAMICAGIWGLYGVILFFLLLAIHMCKLKSFGVPYISPAAPYRLRDWKDFIFRFPLLIMKKRPQMMRTLDDKRQKGNS
ncbi:spore germination protein [Shimazuella sp. AN120528]|uniref:spore germination protein n=1 Tax=Shimazuella soli TaxID=1892854 RepID=UPI001F0EB488|nr:spore germination protein [Shimazuella soli]MCH5584648.1 spore germination protein [Shimazuella soli]